MRSAWALTGLSVAVLLLCLAVGRVTGRHIEVGELRFEGKRAFADMEALVRTFGPRPALAPRSKKVAEWVRDRFLETGVDARVTAGTVRGDVVFNAVATIPGKGDRFLVVLGHHDSVPGAPGAEDNGSAVAALIELARALRDRPLAHTVVLCATDAEETGGAGAELLIAELGRESVERTDACLGLEMLAWGGGRPVMHALNRNYAASTDRSVPGAMPATIAAAAPESVPLGDPLVPILVQSLSRSVTAGTGSDDIHFLREGVPALFLSRSSLTRFYPHYHTESDTPDKLSPDALHSSGRILEAAVLALDAAPPPRDGAREFLLWRTCLLPQRLLAAIAGVPALSLLALALALRRRAPRYAIGAGILALPLISAACRFQPALLIAAWPLAAAAPGFLALKSPIGRGLLFWTAAVPLLSLGMMLFAASSMFGVRLPPEHSVPLALSLAFAASGFLLVRPGLPAPSEAEPGKPEGTPPAS